MVKPGSATGGACTTNLSAPTAPRRRPSGWPRRSRHTKRSEKSPSLRMPAASAPPGVVDVPEEGIVPALRQAGFTDDLAGLYREMIVALNRGHIAWTGQPVRGRVRLDEVLRGLARPA